MNIEKIQIFPMHQHAVPPIDVYLLANKINEIIDYINTQPLPVKTYEHTQSIPSKISHNHQIKKMNTPKTIISEDYYKKEIKRVNDLIVKLQLEIQEQIKYREELKKRIN